MMANRKRNLRREAFLARILFVERVCYAMFEVQGSQVTQPDDIERLRHFRLGVSWALKEFRRLA